MPKTPDRAHKYRSAPERVITRADIPTLDGFFCAFYPRGHFRDESYTPHLAILMRIDPGMKGAAERIRRQEELRQSQIPGSEWFDLAEGIGVEGYLDSNGRARVRWVKGQKLSNAESIRRSWWTTGA